VIGKAAGLFDNKYSAMTQAFGPEARGSACSSQVIVSGDSILYPYVRRPHILVVMSQEAYQKFSPALLPDGMLVYESELVVLANVPMAPNRPVSLRPESPKSSDVGSCRTS
jgi:2-oxoglutarate ferredoxin oxidoreductase subunit gamma